MVIPMPILVVHVYDEFTRDPVPDASVIVYKDGRKVNSEVTGRNGTVVFRLDPGVYTVEVRGQLYFPLRKSVNVTRDMAVSFFITKRTW